MVEIKDYIGRVLEIVEGSSLAFANLDEANLAFANLDEANLAYANLAFANLAFADLAGANLAGANLRGSDLRNADLAGAKLDGADLAGAKLAFANLRGADLSGAQGILCVGPVDSWLMYAVRWADGPRILAGCRWFTVAEARAWWEAGGEAKDPEHGRRMLAGLDALLAIAAAHGWEMADPLGVTQ